MLRYASDENLERDEPAKYAADDGRWDADTIRELRDRHGVILDVRNDAAIALKIVDKDGEYPMVAIGTEDDGTVTFERRYGRYETAFDICKVPALIEDLKEALRVCGWQW